MCWEGTAGDELFGGYDRYYGNRYADYYSHVPHFLRKYAVGPDLGFLPDGQWYKSKSHQLKWMHQLSFHRGGARYAKSLGYFYFRQNMRQGLYGTEMGRVAQEFDSEEAIREPYDRVDANDMLDRMLYADSLDSVAGSSGHDSGSYDHGARIGSAGAIYGS